MPSISCGSSAQDIAGLDLHGNQILVMRTGLSVRTERVHSRLKMFDKLSVLLRIGKSSKKHTRASRCTKDGVPAASYASRIPLIVIS